MFEIYPKLINIFNVLGQKQPPFLYLRYDLKSRINSAVKA